MRIVISSEAEKSSLQTDKGRAKVERGSTQGECQMLCVNFSSLS